MQREAERKSTVHKSLIIVKAQEEAKHLKACIYLNCPSIILEEIFSDLWVAAVALVSIDFNHSFKMKMIIYKRERESCKVKLNSTIIIYFGSTVTKR